VWLPYCPGAHQALEAAAAVAESRFAGEVCRWVMWGEQLAAVEVVETIVLAVVVLLLLLLVVQLLPSRQPSF